jgi:hypothetical protein
VASQWEKIMESLNEWTGIQHRNGESARERKQRANELEKQGGLGRRMGVDDQGQIFRVEDERRWGQGKKSRAGLGVGEERRRESERSECTGEPEEEERVWQWKWQRECVSVPMMTVW